MIVYLDELDFRELFEVRHDRLCNGIQRAVRLTTTREIDVCNAACIFEFSVSGETIKHERETLIALHIARTFEVFIENRADQILFRWDKARHRHFVWQLPANQAVVISEVDIHFYK